MMSTLRRRDGQTFRGNLAILVKGLESDTRADTRSEDVVEGTMRRAGELGFVLDRFDLDEVPPKALERVLYNRGVMGVLIFMPSFRGAKVSLEMNLAPYCCVSAGWGLWQPELDAVQVDYHQTMRLMLERAVPQFGRGIAAIWDFATDEASHRVARGAFLTHHPGGMGLADQLFLSRETITRAHLESVVAEHKISSLILGSSFTPPDWLAEVVPPRNWVWCRDPGNTPHFGWANFQNHLLGEWAVNLLAAKLQMNQAGLPSNRQSVLVPARWIPGHRI
jgi:hypothetical protein